jgi:hypothetical protein
MPEPIGMPSVKTDSGRGAMTRRLAAVKAGG